MTKLAVRTPGEDYATALRPFIIVIKTTVEGRNYHCNKAVNFQHHFTIEQHILRTSVALPQSSTFGLPQVAANWHRNHAYTFYARRQTTRTMGAHTAVPPFSVHLNYLPLSRL